MEELPKVEEEPESGPPSEAPEVPAARAPQTPPRRKAKWRGPRAKMDDDTDARAPTAPAGTAATAPASTPRDAVLSREEKAVIQHAQEVSTAPTLAESAAAVTAAKRERSKTKIPRDLKGRAGSGREIPKTSAPPELTLPGLAAPSSLTPADQGKLRAVMSNTAVAKVEAAPSSGQREADQVTAQPWEGMTEDSTLPKTKTPASRAAHRAAPPRRSIAARSAGARDAVPRPSVLSASDAAASWTGFRSTATSHSKAPASRREPSRSLSRHPVARDRQRSRSTTRAALRDPLDPSSSEPEDERPSRNRERTENEELLPSSRSSQTHLTAGQKLSLMELTNTLAEYRHAGIGLCTFPDEYLRPVANPLYNQLYVVPPRPGAVEMIIGDSKTNKFCRFGEHYMVSPASRPLTFVDQNRPGVTSTLLCPTQEQFELYKDNAFPVNVNKLTRHWPEWHFQPLQTPLPTGTGEPARQHWYRHPPDYNIKDKIELQTSQVMPLLGRAPKTKFPENSTKGLYKVLDLRVVKGRRPQRGDKLDRWYITLCISIPSQQMHIPVKEKDGRTKHVCCANAGYLWTDYASYPLDAWQDADGMDGHQELADGPWGYFHPCAHVLIRSTKNPASGDAPENPDFESVIHGYPSILTKIVDSADLPLTHYLNKKYMTDMCLQAAWYNAFGQIKHLIVPFTKPLTLKWLVSIAQNSDLDEDWFPGEEFLTFVVRTGRVSPQALYVVERLIANERSTISRQQDAMGVVRPGHAVTANELAQRPVDIRSHVPDTKRRKVTAISPAANVVEANFNERADRARREAPLAEVVEHVGPQVEYVSSYPSKEELMASTQADLDATLLDLYARENLPPFVALQEPWPSPLQEKVEMIGSPGGQPLVTSGAAASSCPTRDDPSGRAEASGRVNPNAASAGHDFSDTIQEQAVAETPDQHAREPDLPEPLARQSQSDGLGNESAPAPPPYVTEPTSSPPVPGYPTPPLRLPVPKFALLAQGSGAGSVRAPSSDSQSSARSHSTGVTAGITAATAQLNLDVGQDVGAAVGNVSAEPASGRVNPKAAGEAVRFSSDAPSAASHSPSTMRTPQGAPGRSTPRALPRPRGPGPPAASTPSETVFGAGQSVVSGASSIASGFAMPSVSEVGGRVHPGGLTGNYTPEQREVILDLFMRAQTTFEEIEVLPDEWKNMLLHRLLQSRTPPAAATGSASAASSGTGAPATAAAASSGEPQPAAGASQHPADVGEEETSYTPPVFKGPKGRGV